MKRCIAVVGTSRWLCHTSSFTVRTAESMIRPVWARVWVRPDVPRDSRPYEAAILEDFQGGSGGLGLFMGDGMASSTDSEQIANPTIPYQEPSPVPLIINDRQVRSTRKNGVPFLQASSMTKRSIFGRPSTAGLDPDLAHW